MIRFHRSLVVGSVLMVAAACGTDNGGNASTNSSTPAASTDDALMANGVDLLYKKGDPIAAERVFRQILERNPMHYGARYQLAAAVDRAGRPAEARLLWQDVLKNAQTVNDSATVRLVQKRLAAPDTVGVTQRMVIGLNLLYAQNNPTAAAEEFRKVLAVNPTHYGATYQLARALDRSGKRDEARPLWTKMLSMATAVNDQATADTARARLKQTP
jgi:Tfp pilus assembly protein PilF